LEKIGDFRAFFEDFFEQFWAEQTAKLNLKAKAFPQFFDCHAGPAIWLRFVKTYFFDYFSLLA
jgi:hypothetical protein